MEASGTTPPAEPAQPPPPSTTGTDTGKASGGWRALGVLLALALAFACAVMVIAMGDIGDTPTCDDVRAGLEPPNEDGECFDGSSTQKTITLILGWPSGILAGIAALFALYFAGTGLRGRTLLQLTTAAIVLGGLSILIGSV